MTEAEGGAWGGARVKWEVTPPELIIFINGRSSAAISHNDIPPRLPKYLPLTWLMPWRHFSGREVAYLNGERREERAGERRGWSNCKKRQEMLRCLNYIGLGTVLCINANLGREARTLQSLSRSISQSNKADKTF